MINVVGRISWILLAINLSNNNPIVNVSQIEIINPFKKHVLTSCSDLVIFFSASYNFLKGTYIFQIEKRGQITMLQVTDRKNMETFLTVFLCLRFKNTLEFLKRNVIHFYLSFTSSKVKHNICEFIRKF